MKGRAHSCDFSRPSPVPGHSRDCSAPKEASSGRAEFEALCTCPHLQQEAERGCGPVRRGVRPWPFPAGVAEGRTPGLTCAPTTLLATAGEFCVLARRSLCLGSQRGEVLAVIKGEFFTVRVVRNCTGCPEKLRMLHP